VTRFRKRDIVYGLLVVSSLCLLSGCSRVVGPTPDSSSSHSPAAEKKRVEALLVQIPGVAEANPNFISTPLSKTVTLALQVNTSNVDRLKAIQGYSTELLCSNSAIPAPVIVHETFRWSATLGPNAVNQGPRKVLTPYVTETPGLSIEFESPVTFVTIEANCREFFGKTLSPGSSADLVPADLLSPTPLITAVPSN
jgi:hypothetical protein